MKTYSTIIPYHKIPQYIIPPAGWRNIVLQADRLLDAPRPTAAKLKKAQRLQRLARYYRPGHTLPKSKHDSAAVSEFIQQSLEQRRAAKAAILAQQS